jgi:hypothetical protein
VLLSRPDRLVRKAVRTRYLVTTITEEAFEGVLVDADDRTLVFANTVQLSTDGRETPIAGELWIPRATVKYLQTTEA